MLRSVWVQIPYSAAEKSRKMGLFLFRVNFRVNNLRKMAGDDGREALFFGIDGSPANLLQDVIFSTEIRRSGLIAEAVTV